MKRALAALFLLGNVGNSQISFDVVSVKPAAPSAGMSGGERGGPGTADPERWTLAETTLRNLILRAYGLEAYQFEGPGWSLESRYDVEAKLSPGTSSDAFREMLRSMLRDRFSLHYHFTDKEIVVSHLIAAKGGLKLRPPSRTVSGTEQPGSSTHLTRLTVDSHGFPVLSQGMTLSMSNGRSRCHFNAITMTAFAKVIAAQIGEPVFNDTGLSGEYLVDLFWVNEERLPAAADDPYGGANGPSLSRALTDQLGLSLTRRKRPVKTFVVDSALKTPLEN
jgi:uncharacterized protein (TIGR03435 family)